MVKFNPRPAGVFGRTRPAGGRGRFCPLSNSGTDGRRKTGKTANESSQQDEAGTRKNLLKEVRGQVRVRSKVKTTGFHIIGFEPNWRSADQRYSPRTRPEVSKTRYRT